MSSRFLLVVGVLCALFAFGGMLCVSAVVGVGAGLRADALDREACATSCAPLASRTLTGACECNTARGVWTEVAP